MQISEKYLDRYKLTFADEAELLALAPKKIALNRWQQAGSSSITLDPPTNKFPQSISLLHSDDNPDGAESWELDASLRQTLVRVDGDPKKGYEFQGLLSAADARTWFRKTLGIAAAQAAATED